LSNTLSLHTIIQEETVMGKVVFEIPQSDVPYELRYDDGNSNVTIGVESDPTQAPYLPILRPGSPR
jgi:hypothetical protein